MKTEEKDIFLSTRSNIDLYSYIIGATKKHAEYKLKKKLKLHEYSNSKKISLKLIYHLFKIILKTNLLTNHKLSKFKLYNCEIGRHVISTCYSDYLAHFSSLSLIYKKIKFLVISLNMIFFMKKNQNRIAAIYLDHGIFLNGLFVNYFSNKKTILYSNSYPRGLFFKPLNLNKSLKYEDFLKLRFNKKDKIKQSLKKTIKKKIENSLSKPQEVYPWVKQGYFKKINKNELKKIDYVIYCHSFTDAQLQMGYDGFVTMEDWLKFTLYTLLKKNSKIIVKSHPNFNKFNKIQTYRSNVEVKIFEKIKNEFKDYKNIIFLSDPIKNSDLLKNLNNKRTVLISHHGTSILEGTYLGFKFISYIKNFWSSNYNLTNKWSNKREYFDLLNKEFKYLKFANKNHIFLIWKKIHINQNNFSGKNYFMKSISDYFNINLNLLISRKLKIKKFVNNDKSQIKLINKIINSLESVE